MVLTLGFRQTLVPILTPILDGGTPLLRFDDIYRTPPLPALRRNARQRELPQQPRSLFRVQEELQQHRPALRPRLRLPSAVTLLEDWLNQYLSQRSKNKSAAPK